MPIVTGVIAYVIKNVFSRVWNSDSDMSSRSAAGKLFHRARGKIKKPQQNRMFLNYV